MDNALNQRADSACSMSGTALLVGDAWDDRLRLPAQETVQLSTDRRDVVGVVGPAAQLA